MKNSKAPTAIVISARTIVYIVLASTVTVALIVLIIYLRSGRTGQRHVGVTSTAENWLPEGSPLRDGPDDPISMFTKNVCSAGCCPGEFSCSHGCVCTLAQIASGADNRDVVTEVVR